MRRCLWIVLTGISWGVVYPRSPAFAAILPAHEALSVLIVADAVNPNQLAPADLTEPADFSPALTASDSGLNLGAVLTVDSQCADDALAALEGENRPDVVIYFAHRAARSCAGGDAQASLVTGLENGLAAGLGVVVFHHGLYGDLYTPGAKDSLLRLVGAESSGIAWNTTVGQRVFIVGGDHFVTSNGLTSDGQAPLAAVDGVATGTYPYFDNIPDERYPNTELLTEPGEDRVPLFATDSGGERLLGYALTRPGWTGRVVAYQPGEYQPNALDARAGNNFQILANAIYFAAIGSAEPVPSDTTAATSSAGNGSTSGDSAASSGPAATTEEAAPQAGSSTTELPVDTANTFVSPNVSPTSGESEAITSDNSLMPVPAPPLDASAAPSPAAPTPGVVSSDAEVSESGCSFAETKRATRRHEPWLLGVAMIALGSLNRRRHRDAKARRSGAE